MLDLNPDSDIFSSFFKIDSLVPFNFKIDKKAASWNSK